MTVDHVGDLIISKIGRIDICFDPENTGVSRYSELFRKQDMCTSLVVDHRGPASIIKNKFFMIGERVGSIGTDYVSRCIRSPFWPPEAFEWKDRKRCHGWPDMNTINLVIKNGCHVVNAAHIDCSGDDFQWRISFSKAEIILIRSWSPSQQLVYHLLRYFAKRELMRKEWRNTDEILSTYSFKTLMLWQCEQRPWSWWNSRSLMGICCDLLKIMFDWLTVKLCRNYFIKDCNLFDHEMNESNSKLILSKLSEYTDRNRVTDWFNENCSTDGMHCSELSTAEYFSSFSFVDNEQYSFKHIQMSMDQMLQTTILFATDIGPSTQLPTDIIPHAFCVKHIGLIENALFVDFYKGHIMLQALTHNRTHKKHDSLVAMLCTLFFKFPPFDEEVSVYQSIARKRYVMVAEIHPEWMHFS